MIIPEKTQRALDAHTLPTCLGAHYAHTYSGLELSRVGGLYGLSTGQAYAAVRAGRWLAHHPSEFRKQILIIEAKREGSTYE